MKKYLIVVTILIIIIILSFFSYYVWGFYLNLSGDVSSFTSTDNDNIYVNNEKFIIKGVNMPDMIRELTSSGLFFLATLIASVVSLAFIILPS